MNEDRSRMERRLGALAVRHGCEDIQAYVDHLEEPHELLGRTKNERTAFPNGLQTAFTRCRRQFVSLSKCGNNVSLWRRRRRPQMRVRYSLHSLVILHNSFGVRPLTSLTGFFSSVRRLLSCNVMTGVPDDDELPMSR